MVVNPESIRLYCLSLSNVAEDIKWDDDLVYTIGKKMFAVINLDDSKPNWISFKCAPDRFLELTEIDGIIPAPYLARYGWVTIRKLDVLSESEVKELIQESHNLVFKKLSKKLQTQLRW